MGVSRTQVVRFIRKGDKGETGAPGKDGTDGLSIVVSPDNIVLKKGKRVSNQKIYVDLYVGETRIDYDNSGTDPNGLHCSGLADVIPTGLNWTFQVISGRFNYKMSYNGTADIDAEVPFTVQYNGVSYSRSFCVKTIADGEKGDTGADGSDGANYSDNLLLKSAAVTTNSSYNIANYDIAETPEVGKTYTITIWGSLGSGKNKFMAYNSGGSVKLCDISQVADGVYQGTFAWVNTSGSTTIATPTKVSIYTYPSSATATSTINKIKLEEGANTKPVWTPSTAEMIGERGPAIRGPRDWGNTQPSYTFYSGAAGEPFIDLVVYGGYYYLCKQTHGWNSNYRPGTTNGATYWQLVSDYEAIATKILLAEYALVKNLGVTAIEMTSSSGAVLFTAKDGAVTCNTGNFKNINISGTSVFTGLVKKAKTVVTSANFAQFFTLISGTSYYIDLEKCGTWIDLQYLPATVNVYAKLQREYTGNTILIYNRTRYTLGLFPRYKSGTQSAVSGGVVVSNNFAAFKFDISVADDEEVFVISRTVTGAIDTSLD